MEQDVWLQWILKIGSSVKSFLGPHKAIKAVVEGDSGQLCSDVLTFMKSLPGTNPVIQLIIEICDGMDQSVGSGVTTLVNMISFWASPLASLLRKGVPFVVVGRLVEEALSVCLRVLDQESHALEVSELQHLEFPFCFSCRRTEGNSEVGGECDCRMRDDHLQVMSANGSCQPNGAKGDEITVSIDDDVADKEKDDNNDDDFSFDGLEINGLGEERKGVCLEGRPPAIQAESRGRETGGATCNVWLASRDNSSDKREQKKGRGNVGVSGSHLQRIIQLRNWQDVHEFSQLLCHGKRDEMELVYEIMMTQQSLHLDADGIFFRHVNGFEGGMERRSRVVRGFVFAEEGWACRPTLGQLTGVLIIAGDVTAEFRHSGYKSSGVMPSRSSWLANVRNAIKDLTNVGAIVCQGRIDPAVVDMCNESGVMAFSCASPKEIITLCQTTGATRLTYLQLARPEHVGRYVKLKVVKSTVNKYTASPRCVGGNEGRWISLKPHKNMNQVLHGTDHRPTREVHTIIMCSPTDDLFRRGCTHVGNCVRRMKNALDSRRVLPGAGDIELMCAAELRSGGGGTRGNDDYKPLVFEAVADGLETFAGYVILSCGEREVDCTVDLKVSAARASWADSWEATNGGHTICVDEYRSKAEGWKRAMGFLRLWLQADPPFDWEREVSVRSLDRTT